MFILALACLPEGQIGVEEPDLPDTLEHSPDIELSSMELVFDATRPGEVLQQELEIHNVGQGTLALQDVLVSGAFEVVLDELSIPPGDSVTARLRFDPVTAFEHSGELSILSNDPDSPEVTASLSGVGVAPVLDLHPTDIDLDQVPVGCEEQVAIFLFNNGNDELVIDDYAFAANTMELADPPTLPWTLGPEESLQLELVFAPLGPEFEEGKLTFVSNDPLGDRTASVFGEAYEELVQETFDARGYGQIDILWHVDHTIHNGWYKHGVVGAQEDLGNLETFVEALDTQSVDWRMGVVTDDDACFNADWIDHSMSWTDQAADFATMWCDNWAGYYGTNCYSVGSKATQGLYLLSKATSASCNADFFRSNSDLVVISLNEDADTSPDDWSDYYKRFKATGNGTVHAFAWGGGSSSSCGTAIGDFTDLAAATGGEVYDLCTATPEDDLAEIAAAIAPYGGDFTLEQEPAPASIQVLVDSVLLDEGWSFDTARNTIAFEDPPTAGSTVMVRYHPIGICD